MATFDAIELVLPDPFAETLSYASPSMIEMLSTGGSSITTHYLMRGFRTLTSDYETWIATNSPNSNNPSGQPIINITIQSVWSK